LPVEISTYLADPGDRTSRALAAMDLLQSLGPKAGSAAPPLIKCFYACDRRLHAAYPPNPNAKPNVPDEDEDYEVCTALISIVGKVGAGKPEAITMLLAALHGYWTPAPEALADISHNDPSVIPILARELYSTSAQARFGSVEALTIIGPAARETAPRLRELSHDTHDENPNMPRFASEALWSVDNDASRLIPSLVRDLNSFGKTNETRVWTLLERFGSFGPQATPAVPALVEVLLNDSNERLRAKAAATLGRIGPAASNSIPALQGALQDPYFNVREAVTNALKQISPPGGPA
jgi:hypothetical protein